MQNEWIDKYIKQYVYYTCPTGLINTTSSLPPPPQKKNVTKKWKQSTLIAKGCLDTVSRMMFVLNSIYEALEQISGHLLLFLSRLFD